MSRRGPKRKDKPRFPNGEIRNSDKREERVAPTTETIMRRIDVIGHFDPFVSPDHPVDVMFARRPCELSRPDYYVDPRNPQRTSPAPMKNEAGEEFLLMREDPLCAERRRDAAGTFANLAWHVFGQPFAGIDAATRRMVPPSENADDADHRKARQTDDRTPEERAEDVRARYEAMLTLVRRGTVREWVLRQVVQYGQPIAKLARSASKRERLRLLLIDALDLIGDPKDVRKAEDDVRAMWSRRAA